MDDSTICVDVEGDGLYVFDGPDAAERYERWALDGAPTFTRID